MSIIDRFRRWMRRLMDAPATAGAVTDWPAALMDRSSVDVTYRGQIEGTTKGETR